MTYIQTIMGVQCSRIAHCENASTRQVGTNLKIPDKCHLWAGKIKMVIVSQPMALEI